MVIISLNDAILARRIDTQNQLFLMQICCTRVWYIFDFLVTLFRISQMMPGGMPGGGMGGGRAPMLVLNPNTQRQGDDSTKTQTQNVGAAKVG